MFDNCAGRNGTELQGLQGWPVCRTEGAVRKANEKIKDKHCSPQAYTHLDLQPIHTQTHIVVWPQSRAD